MIGRRAILELGAITLAAAAAGCSCERDDATMATDQLAFALRGLLHRPETAVAWARQHAHRLPEGTRAPALAAALLRDDPAVAAAARRRDLAALRQHLAAAIVADFAAGELVRWAEWDLSVTEARVLALVAQTVPAR